MFIYKMKDKNHMIISTDVQNHLTKFKIHLWCWYQQTGYSRNAPQHIKAIYDKPTANTLNDEKLKTFLLREE